MCTVVHLSVHFVLAVQYLLIDVWRKRRPKSPTRKRKRICLHLTRFVLFFFFSFLFFADEILGDSVGGDILTEPPPPNPHPL